jgi:hypothetical protein
MCALAAEFMSQHKANRPSQQSNFWAGGKHDISFFYCELSVPTVLSLLDQDAGILHATENSGK